MAPLDQKLVTDALGRWKLDKAEEAQTMLDEFMPIALAQWPLDPMIVKLDGYHIKKWVHGPALESGAERPRASRPGASAFRAALLRGALA